MREIPLTQGKVALIDDEDYDRVSRFKWGAVESGGIFYATRTEQKAGRKTTTRMHRFILSANAGDAVDHRDGDGLNNQKANLRLATALQNSRNQRRRADNRSGFKGVKANGTKWMARIRTKGDRIFIGNFSTKEDAARAYDAVARVLFGEFARLNFPRESDK